MKKLFTILAIGVVCSYSLKAQDNIKFNLTNLAVATYTFSYEHVMGDKSSLQLAALISSYSTGITSFSGFGLMPELRLYLSGEKKAPHGVYFAPWLRYQSLSLSGDVMGETAKATSSSFGGGIVFGAQGLFAGDHLVIDAFLGLGYLAGSVKYTSTVTSGLAAGPTSGILPRLGLNIGYAF